MLEIIRTHDSETDETPLSVLEKRLEGDLDRMRSSLGCTIEYVRAEKRYHLRALDHPLIDLSDEALHGMAFLHKAFVTSEAPHSAEVLRLLSEIERILDDDRKREMTQLRAVEMQVRSRDAKEIDLELLKKLLEACSTRNQITFTYRSPRQSDEQPRLHRVEPLRCFVEPLRHHTILEAYYLETDGPKGRVHYQGFRQYRVQRMSDLHILPQRFVPRVVPPGKDEIVYLLAPDIARLQDVTPVHPDSQITYRADGSALVSFWSNNLLMDLKSLLYYGAQCEVIGDENARRMMRALVQEMWGVYRTPDA
jgi:predicted DNA-binding transcriptional regulator YafY